MTQPSPANMYLQAVAAATVPSSHPYGGIEFRSAGKAVCFARLVNDGPSAVGLAGMFAPVRGGGRKAMGFLCLLADLHLVTLRLVASSSVPSRMNTSELAAWYRRYGFVGDEIDLSGGIPMERPPKAFLVVRQGIGGLPEKT